MNERHVEIIRDRSALRARIASIYAERRRAYLIHYCCESFSAPSGEARITGIAVRNLQDGQTKSWTIHGEAQKRRSAVENLDLLERRVLDGLKGFFKQYDDCTFIHWNMRDSKFGFEHLHHRAAVLGCKLTRVPDSQKLDLSDTLYKLFGDAHASNTSKSGVRGRLFSVAELNGLNVFGAMTGVDEPVAFSLGNYAALDTSLLRKLDIMSNIFVRVHLGQFKHSAPWRDTWGLSLGVAVYSGLTHWMTKVFVGGCALFGAAIKLPAIIAFGKQFVQ